jgi:curli biogenesis system outer membrane secretion channel CsgG
MRRLAALLSAGLLAGCATTIDPDAPVEHVQPLSGSPVVAGSTEYTEALHCLAGYARGQSFPPPRVAVGHISDLTGADDYLSGRRLTQGATLMAITAVSEAGMRLVERFDLGVVQVELGYTESGLLRDAPGTLREIRQGQMEGADLYLVGGITEFNPNIRSGGLNAFANTGGESGGAVIASTNDYIIDVGIDLRLIDVRSTEVLSVRSLRKQVRGREVEAGVFAFFDGTVIDIGGGQRALEPVQTAVRTMVERAVFEFMGGLYNLESGSCLDGRPATPRAAPAAAVRPAPEPEPDARPAPIAAEPVVDSYGVRLAAHHTLMNVEQSWSNLRRAHSELLDGRQARVARLERPDQAPVFLLQAGEWPDASAAETVCARIRDRGAQCEVGPFNGTPLLRR